MFPFGSGDVAAGDELGTALSRPRVPKHAAWRRRVSRRTLEEAAGRRGSSTSRAETRHLRGSSPDLAEGGASGKGRPQEKDS